jgi:hypothetical protein
LAPPAAPTDVSVENSIFVDLGLQILFYFLFRFISIHFFFIWMTTWLFLLVAFSTSVTALGDRDCVPWLAADDCLASSILTIQSHDG